MLHFEEMQVETALFFETIEQIYARVFRLLKPEIAVPGITVSFRRYANANSRIKLHQAELTVHISDLLESAPAPIQEALAYILLAKLFDITPAPDMLARYRRYLNRADLRCNIRLIKRQRGRKVLRDAKGEVYDLGHIFDRLNKQYFDGVLARPKLGWSIRPSRTTLGHYDVSHHAIALSKVLDSEKAPPLIVKFVLFHEMLHLQFPTDSKKARARIHTNEFRKAERSFRRYEEARTALKQFIQPID